MNLMAFHLPAGRSETVITSLFWDFLGEYFGSALNSTILGANYTNMSVFGSDGQFLAKLVVDGGREGRARARGGESCGVYIVNLDAHRST
jgi:hypothetical protein